MTPAEVYRRAAGGGGVLLIAAACQVQAGRSETGPLAAAPPLDTLRAECPEGLPFLRPARRPTGREITRILPAPDGILLVTPDGLFRSEAGRTDRLQSGGRDWALAGGVLARLAEDRIDVFDYRPHRPPAPRGTLPAERHEASIALAGGDLFVHSAFHDDALVIRRSLDDGAALERFLPVERDLVRTLLAGPERLHEDEGALVADRAHVVLVPTVRDPVTVLGVSKGTGRILELAEGRRGEVRFDRERRLDRRACRLCVRRVEIHGRVSVVPLYAAAAIAEGVLWLVRLDPPGSSRGVLLRADLASLEVGAWRLLLPGPPTAMAVVGDSLLLASDRDLWVLATPVGVSGAICPATAHPS